MRWCMFHHVGGWCVSVQRKCRVKHTSAGFHGLQQNLVHLFSVGTRCSSHIFASLSLQPVEWRTLEHSCVKKNWLTFRDSCTFNMFLGENLQDCGKPCFDVAHVLILPTFFIVNNVIMFILRTDLFLSVCYLWSEFCHKISSLSVNDTCSMKSLDSLVRCNCFNIRIIQCM